MPEISQAQLLRSAQILSYQKQEPCLTSSPEDVEVQLL